VSYPDFNLPTDSRYDAMSAAVLDLPPPAGCYVYEPDNHDDYQCLALWQPAPELGARQWTRHGRRILLGLYRDEGRPGLAETRVIFRLLPCFKPVPVAEVLDLLAAANPETARHVVALTDINTGSIVLQSEVQAFSSSEDYRLHAQQLNEQMRPLRQEYDARGRVVPPNLRFSKNANASLHLTPPLVNQYGGPQAVNPFLPVYDFYGFPINDGTRDPYHSDQNVVYDSASVTGLKLINYNGPLHDVFGDYVVGARANNTVITRKPVQPILVDHHNKPLKRPIRRG
jgi:hypothetical protein